jgi:hypothetical protein
MKRIMIFATFLPMVFLVSCRPTEETVTEVENGPFKILIRSQEFHHSAIRNIDICVAQTSSRKFPRQKGQCFLHGFDLDGLSVKWLTESKVQISFRCGRVTSFTNDAIVSPKDALPVEVPCDPA